MAKLTNKKIVDLAKRFKELAAQGAQIKQEKEEIKELLKQEMRNRNLNELLVDVYKITYSQYTQTKFDTKSFSEEHKKMYEKYLYTQNLEKLLVNLGK